MLTRRCFFETMRNAAAQANPARAYATHSAAPAVDSRPLLTQATGFSGRDYTIEKTLQDRNLPWSRVYLGSSEGRKYMLKEIPQDWKTRQGVYNTVGESPYVRLPVDKAPDRRLLIFEYLEHDYLDFVNRELPIKQTKHILKCVLKALATLHARHVVHNDVKPTNVFIDTRPTADGQEIERVQLSDLEGATRLEPHQELRGIPLGNYMWRSPECYALGPVESPSDIFSFGVMCASAVSRRCILSVDKAKLRESMMTREDAVLENQVSYFADDKGFTGFLRHLGRGHEWLPKFQGVLRGFGPKKPQRPFKEWEGEGLNADFKDLIGGLTNFDPRGRLTAQEALGHRWFEGV